MCLRTNLEVLGPAGGGASPPGAVSKGQKNSEKRKEKSRDAARCRRGRESEYFSELADALPLPRQTISQLDKASVMRLTLAFLKTRALCGAVVVRDPGTQRREASEEDGLLLKALDGFLLVLSTDGDIVFTSENIVNFLGLAQVDVMGQSVYEYLHPCDHDETKALLSGGARDPAAHPCHSFLRLKCTLTNKGRSVNLKSASYKVVQVNGEFVGEREEQTWLVALATPVPHPSNIEFPLDKQTFVSKHSLDMKFTYVDDNVSDFCCYCPEDLVGRSLYEMHHALDSSQVKDAYRILRSKGQVETGRYRFLARGGGYVWVVTQATLIHGPKDSKPQYVVCLNYVVSGIECKGEILSEVQLMHMNNNNNNNNNSSNKNKGSKQPEPVEGAVTPLAQPPVGPPTPQAKAAVKAKVAEVSGSGFLAAPPARPPVVNTFKIFAPRTEDMKKGFLIFSDDDPKCAVLKEEPEDLTHLAPSGGETCVPLLEEPILLPGSTHQPSLVAAAAHQPTPIYALNDMFPLPYDVPIEKCDVHITSPLSDQCEEQSCSPRYLYEEGQQATGIKCMNSLSGGKLLFGKGGHRTPSPDSSSQHSVDGGTELPKPLLSQAALSPPARKQPKAFGDSYPRSITESLFTKLDDSCTPGSDSDLFTRLDLKLEDQNMDADEFEMRAPYIPLSNEMLMLGPDDILWGAESDSILPHRPTFFPSRESKSIGDQSMKEESSLAHLLRETDPPMTGGGPGRSLNQNNQAGGGRSQCQQNKFLDGGGNFVDPNKVLPGHFAGKEELEGCVGSGMQADPPPLMVQEPVDPPPPLLTLDPIQVSPSIKRGYSPFSSPTPSHKKLCSNPCQQQLPQAKLNPKLEKGQQAGVLRPLTTPYAPTMQKLLVSKEPITVRGGRPGGTGSGTQTGPTDKSHSVLRNLLNMNGDGCLVLEPDSGGGSQQGAGERLTTMLLASGKDGVPLGLHHKLRLMAGSQGTLMQAFKLASSSSSQGREEGGGRRAYQKDPLLLLNPDTTTIPNLMDLTQQDCEVNAPANNISLLQGSDLLLALDQSL